MRLFPHRDHWIDKNHEIGPRADAFDWIRRVSFAGIEMGPGSRGDMSSSGKTQDADSLWIEAPFQRSRAYDTNRTSSVLHWRRGMITRAQPVFEDKGGNAERVEPLSDWPTLVICQMGVPASGTNNDRRA